jgi:protein-ribulosamine 3-kinase
MSAAIHELLGQANYNTPSSDSLGDFPIDENVLAKFPAGTRILSANKYGTSAWTITAKIDISLLDGSEEHYFLKCAANEGGRIMMEGEFAAMTELHKSLPGFVPKPYAYGKFAAGNLETYFLIEEFIDLNDKIPEPNQLCSKLARLHRNSVSPTGKFGFEVTTCNGRMPQKTAGWEASWTKCFARMLQHVMELEMEANGVWEALDVLEKRLLENVVPRLIGAVESDGHSIKPCIIHGKLS